MKGHDLSAGDVVSITDWRGSTPDDRVIGTVIEFDIYHPHPELKFSSLTDKPETMCCVLWSHGVMSWILCNRLSRAFDGGECKSLPERGIKDVGNYCEKHQDNTGGDA